MYTIYTTNILVLYYLYNNFQKFNLLIVNSSNLYMELVYQLNYDLLDIDYIYIIVTYSLREYIACISY